MDLKKVVTTPVARAGAAAQNALEVVRFGGLDTGEEPSPYEVVSSGRVHRLRRYFPDVATGPAVVLVPPMMIDADVYDVSPGSTAVGVLREHGIDPWVVDFGAPEREQGGLERTLADHVVAVAGAIDEVRRHTDARIHLSGYSQGGMFCYQAAAYRRSESIDSVVSFGSPADPRKAAPFGIPEGVFTRAAGLLADGPLGGVSLPAWASRTGFRLIAPAKTVRQRLDFVRQLHDREALLPRERQRRFLEAEGWVAWPGPALADFLRQFIAHNRMLEGGMVIGDRLVTLADITSPILSFVGSVDEIAPAPAVRAIRRAAPRAEVYEVELRSGHFGLVVGRTATQISWPTVAAWAHHRDGEGELPELVHRVEPEDAEVRHAAAANGGGAGLGLELAAGAGLGVARAVTGSATRTLRSVRELTREAATQLPRLARLGQIQPGTQISLALLLDEQARDNPDGVCFLWEDRAHLHAAARRRIDNVVAGLLSLGVRQGEPVGVLMATRPSALVVVAALNRIGAVTVLLRPDGDVAVEARLGGATRIVADPEHADAARAAGVDVAVLGGGGDERDLGDAVLDMERIDPEAVDLPSWYRPNPGRGRDLAFILFTGEGAGTRVNRVTNGRWAMSAFGTASSAALGDRDTVYSVTPLHHSSALLMSLGGAVAGGARIALAQGYDPGTFWDEVRRYGVTVASYTWTMLRELVDAPRHPAERGHPLRLLVGSGMPVGLWERVLQRFAPAQVVEFYASVEGEAILVNLHGSKVGSLGRPLPGTAEVRLAAWDLDHDRLFTGPDGFGRESPRGEVGMLLSRSHGGTGNPGVLRSVFARDDAWIPTRDLFRQDADGDFWLVDPIQALVRTPQGLASPSIARDALASLEAVDLAVAYGVPVGDHELLVGAVTPRPGAEVRAADATRVLSGLDEQLRPAVIQVVDEIPVTSWYRPDVRPLRERGVPAPGEGRTVWGRRASSNGYQPLSAAAHRRLTVQ